VTNGVGGSVPPSTMLSAMAEHGAGTDKAAGVARSELEAGARKRYRSPQLEQLGTIAQLSQGGVPSSQSDSGQNNMRP
jgi:hypothetical protein